MTPQQVVSHLRDRLGAEWSAERVTSVEERSDGNINVVYVVRNGTESVVVKQGLPYVRILRDWTMPAERICREAELYEGWAGGAPGSVPAVYDLDREHCILVMEYLDDCAVWRNELTEGRSHASAASDVGTILARTAFSTSLLSLPAGEVDRRIAQSSNQELETLMKDVLFRQPWREHERNDVPSDIAEPWNELRSDGAFQYRVASLHRAFVHRREVLAHGDLHTGSIMVGGGRARMFDAEFARYAPAGFDLGAFWGSLLLAAVGNSYRGLVAPDEILEMITDSWASYRSELARLWPTRTLDANDAFLDGWLHETESLACGFAGIEAGRRMIGRGRPDDIDALPADVIGAARRAVIAECRDWVLDASGSVEALVRDSSARSEGWR